MSIEMDLLSARMQTESVERICQQRNHQMKQVSQSLLAFIDEEGLQSQSYEATKDYLSTVYLPLIDGVILLNEAIIKAHQQYVMSYVDEVDVNSLRSDVLEMQLRSLQDVVSQFEQIGDADSPFRYLTGGVKELNTGLRHRIQQKLDLLIQYDSRSVMVFNEVNQLLALVKRGLQQVAGQRAWDPVNQQFNTNNLDLSWVAETQNKKALSDLTLVIGQFPKVKPKMWRRLADISKRHGDIEAPTVLVDHMRQMAKTNDVVRNDLDKRLYSNTSMEVSPFTRKKLAIGTFKKSFDYLAKG